MSVPPSVCPLVFCLSLCLSVCLYVCLSICFSICLSICLPAYLLVSPSPPTSHSPLQYILFDQLLSHYLFYSIASSLLSLYLPYFNKWIFLDFHIPCSHQNLIPPLSSLPLFFSSSLFLLLFSSFPLVLSSSFLLFLFSSLRSKFY